MQRVLQNAFALVALISLSFFSAQAQELPLTFEDGSITYDIFGFGSASFEAIPADIVDNPDQSGINTSAVVATITKTEGAQVWAGASIPLVSTIDLTEGSEFVLKVWSPRAGIPIQVKFEDTTSPPDADGNPTIIAELAVNTTVDSAWEELTYDMALDVANYSASNNYNQVVLFPDFGTEGIVGGETFYFDDFQSASATSIDKQLAAQLNMKLFPNPASNMAKVSFDMPVTGQTSLTLVNMLGQKLTQMELGNLPVGAHQHEFSVQSMPSGVYYVILAIDGQTVQHRDLVITK